MKLYDNDSYRDGFMEAVYNLLSDDSSNDRANQVIDLFDAAPAVEAEPVPPNDPLTLEELRGMNGEPVWSEGPHLSRYDVYCGYTIIGGIEQFYKAALPSHAYGAAWLAYRRRPGAQSC